MGINKTVRAAIVVSLMSGLYASQTLAAGFALIENSASGMGNAFAGGAAIADDASTVWFNPAGMTRLKGEQITVAGHIISPKADFTDVGSVFSATTPITGGTALNGSDDDGGATALVPNFYYVTQLDGEAWFGLGITVPFGLSTEYDEDWIGRYHATTSEVHSININPSFAFKYNDKLAVGLGLSLQYITAKLENKIDSAITCLGVVQSAQIAGGADLPTAQAAAGAACLPGGAGLIPGTAAQDSSQSLEGNNWNIGWNVGLLYDLDSASRVGLSYRSSMDANLEGDVDFTVNPAFQSVIDGLGPLSTFLSDTSVQAGIELPAQMSVSYVRDVDAKLTVMADITWTEWSNFDALVIKFDNLMQPTSTQPENWEDSYRYAIGASYKVDDKIIVRAGVAIDETPIPDATDRTARIPGNDRTWISLGFGYKIDENTSVDVGYSHLMVDDTEIDNTIPLSGQQLIGEYSADVDILSIQGNYKF